MAGSLEICPDTREVFHHYFLTLKVEYPLIEILLIALCETISGAQGYTEITEMAHEREGWYRTTLGLPLSNGVPSHDTFGNVFRMLDTATFHTCFLR
jgi:hypothetical protein